MAVNVSGGPLSFDATIDGTQFQAQINMIEQRLIGLTRTTNQQADAVERLAKRASVAIGSYLSLNAVGGFISQVVQVRGEFEKLEVSFRTMLGNKQKADRLLAEAVQLAATTPFTLQEVGTGAKQLLAYGTEAQKIIPTLKMLGDVAAGTGAPLNDIVYLYGTLQTQGRAYTRDILQFTSRGIPIIDELAKQFGVTKDKVQQLVEAGKVGFPEVEKAFKNLTGVGGLFFNLMEAQSKTLTGQLSNLQDSFSQMLNEIGKSNQGLLSGGIQGLSYLIQNYQKVIDVLEVLVITYGAYKAAVIATTAYQAIQTQIVAGYTLAETLRYRAMLLSEAAMKILNKTMLSNPAVLVAAGVAALVSAFLIFRKETDNVKTSQQLLADAQKNVGDRLSETEAKIRPYLDALKGANLSEQERVNIYEKLKAIDPAIIQGLTTKTLSYQTLAANVNLYLDSLRKQYALEANKTALQESIKNENDIAKKLAASRTVVVNLQKSLQGATGQGASSLSVGLSKAKDDVAELEKALQAQKGVSTQLGETQVQSETKVQAVKLRTVDVIDEEIKAQKELQKDNSTNAAQYQEYQKKINALEAERKAIVGASKSEIRAAQAAENKINKLLEDRKGLLQDIADLQRDAKQSGLLKEQSEIDKVNEKYDQLILKIDAFNKKNPKFAVGQNDISRLNTARAYEISSTQAKQDADRYIKQLDIQKNLFQKYEEDKRQIGLEKANSLYKEETKGFASYLSFLQSEAAKIAPKIALGVANIGDATKFKAIITEMQSARRANADQEIQDIVNVLQATATFDSRRQAIEAKYNKDFDALSKLRGKISEDEFANRLKLLKDANGQELTELNNQIVRQSVIYKKLNTDIIGYSRSQIKALIKSLQTDLANGFTLNGNGEKIALSPQMKKDLQDGINQLKGFYGETAEIFGTSVKQLDEMSKKAAEVGSIFSTLANTLGPLNAGLGNALSQASDLAGVASNAFSGIASFASGDYLAAAQSAAAVIASFGKVLAEAKQSKIESRKAVEDFYAMVQAGELETNLAYRERLRTQQQINGLKLKGIEDENKLLAEQRQQNLNDYNRIFAELQKQQFISGEDTKKGKGSLLFGLTGFFTGLGGKTSVQQQLSDLLGMNYDQIEKLFNSGQLTDRAKELFLQLQKLKNEGLDIDKQLAELKQQQDELFTGATVDSITDSIIEGFKNGKRSAADFADTFQDLMQTAVFNALKYKTLEPLLADFYTQFSAKAGDLDGLTSVDIADLQNLYDEIIKKTSTQFEQLAGITKLNFGSSNSGNALTGAIKGITAEQATLLAGQFGGLRLTALDHLNVAKQNLDYTIKIERNTALAVISLASMDITLKDLKNFGIKIKP